MDKHPFLYRRTRQRPKPCGDSGWLPTLRLLQRPSWDRSISAAFFASLRRMGLCTGRGLTRRLSEKSPQIQRATLWFHLPTFASIEGDRESGRWEERFERAIPTCVVVDAPVRAFPKGRRNHDTTLSSHWKHC